MKIKRILSLVIVSLLFSCLLQSENILAKTGDLAGEKKSDYAYAINDLYERELLSGIMSGSDAPQWVIFATHQMPFTSNVGVA